MGRILNLETATTNCSVSVSVNGELIAIREENTPNYSHSEQLHLFMDEVLKAASLSFLDLDAIAVSKGPGSYTGLRIGVSAAKGLCFALDIPLISVATLRSMASQVRITDGVIISVLDARRMEVYAGVYDRDYKPLSTPWAEVLSESSFEDFVKDQKVYIVGDGAAKCQEILKHSNFDFNTMVIPSAREMAKLSYEAFSRKAFEDVAYFEPYYLKDFIVQKKLSSD